MREKRETERGRERKRERDRRREREVRHRERGKAGWSRSGKMQIDERTMDVLCYLFCFVFLQINDPNKVREKLTPIHQ